MRLGLVVRCALITLARRGDVIQYRVAAAIVATAVVAGCAFFWDRLGWEQNTIAGTAWFGLSKYAPNQPGAFSVGIGLFIAWIEFPLTPQKRDLWDRLAC